jgi:energy-coupling factor transporter ATP-binding protein EcfA2
MKPKSLNFRSEKNVIFVTHNMKEVVNHIQNVVPVKGFDGKRSKNSTLMNLTLFMYKRMLSVEDVRSTIT